jgi:hypothetical protein
MTLQTIKSPALFKLLAMPLVCLAGAGVGYLGLQGHHTPFVTHLALPICLLLLATIALSVYPSIRKFNREQAKGDLQLLLLSIGIVAIYNWVDTGCSKVIMDELVLQGSALQLTEHNTYLVPEFSHNLTHPFALGEGIPDKRPPLFPVVLSLVHRLVGYDLNNGLWLNSLLGCGLLFVIGKAGNLIVHRHGGILLILGFASLPLLSQNVNSQHFEILYLLLIACLFWVSLRVTTSDEENEISIAYLLAAGIALTRYEGLIFFMVPFFLHMRALHRGRSVTGLTKAYLLCPLVTLFIFALIGHISAHQQFWQLDDTGGAKAFSLHYWGRNLQALTHFVFEVTRSLPNSLALSIVGVSSVPVVLLSYVRFNQSKGEKQGIDDGIFFTLGIFSLSALTYGGLLFSYHWGHVDSHATARFVLFPLLLLAAFALFALRKNTLLTLVISLAVLLFCGIRNIPTDINPFTITYGFLFASLVTGILIQVKRPKSFKMPVFLTGFWVAFLMLETFPAIQQKKYEQGYIPMYSANIFFDWIDQHKETNSVFIARSSLFGMLAREPSTALLRFEENPHTLLNLKKRNLFTDLFVLQEVKLDGPEFGTPMPEWTIPKGLDWELVKFRRITDNYGARMIRITGKSEPL